jgi:Fur family transcriptional regulator, ferric uptake regulator
MDIKDKWISLLQESGCRITSPRAAIIDAILNSQRGLEPLELFDLVRKSHPGIGLVTVYRTLDRLENLGLIQRVHQENGCHMVMKAAVGHEHYLLCTRCGRAVLFDGDDLSRLVSRVESSSGYKVSDHWLQLFGLCPSCQPVNG